MGLFFYRVIKQPQLILSVLHGTPVSDNNAGAAVMWVDPENVQLKSINNFPFLSAMLPVGTIITSAE